MCSARRKRVAVWKLTAMRETSSAPKKKRRIGYWIFLGVVLLILGVQYLLAQSRAVCDWYLDRVAPLFARSIGGLMSKIPAPVCEITMIAAAVFCIVLVILLILLIFLRRREKYRRFVGFCVKLTLAVALVAVISEPIYSSIGNNSTVLGKADYTAQTHDFDELTNLWNRWMRQANALSVQVDRDEYGHIVQRSDSEIRDALQKAAEKLSAEYPRLGLPVPHAKTSAVSQLVAGMNISAYYIEPWRELVFTVGTQSRPRYPSVYAHEYSHFCGYHREDEANYLGLLLCLASDDPNLRYEGLLDVRTLIWDAIVKEYFGDREPVYDDPDYLAFTETTEPFADAALMLGDMTGNYKLYHKQRGEENPEDNRVDNPELISSDKAKELIAKAGQKHSESVRNALGAHYYDGVVQLMLDLDILTAE